MENAISELGRNYPGIALLEKLPLWRGTADFDLNIPRKILHRLGDPQDRLATIHVARTNGKGTVCSLLSAMFIAQGYRVGQFTSPHLSQVTERCLLGGRPVEPGLFSDVVLEVASVAKAENVEPSYFELITVASFLIFFREGVERAVIEVGLGGRLDATNVIKCPALTVISNIDYDHMQHLGESLEKIAAEKAGIIKTGSQCVVGAVPSEVQTVILDTAESVGSRVEFLNVDYTFDPVNKLMSSWDRDFRLNPQDLRYQAPYYLHNVLVAVRAAERLGIPEASIRRGLKIARWPGRLESVSKAGASVLMDVAHNPGGLSALFEHLRGDITAGKITSDVNEFIFIISILDRKDWKKMLDLLREFENEMRVKGVAIKAVFTDSGHESAVPPAQLQEYYGSGEAIGSADKALETLLGQSTPRSLIVLTGSIYLVGRLRPTLVSEPFSTIHEEN